tara:strand:+ start:120 stop:275 length:156 start_codon:yes stop_codon:yes gene_type:complete
MFDPFGNETEKPKKEGPPSEAFLLFLMMAIIFGGTLFVNWILWLFIPGLTG